MSDEKDNNTPPDAKRDTNDDPDLTSPTAILRPIGLFVIVLFVFVIFQVLASQIIPDTRVVIILTQIIVILGAALIYRAKFARRKTRWPAFRSLGMPVWALPVVLVASVTIGLLGNALGALTIQIFPVLEPIAEQYQTQIESLLLTEDYFAQFIGALSIVVVAPVCEEVLFRGTILPEQRRSQYAAGAVLLNGILFSTMHMNPVGFLALAVIGCYFAHVTLRSGSLWGAILGHGALNFVNGVLLLRLTADIGTPDELGWVEISIALGILVPAAALLWWTSIWAIRRS